MYYWEVIECMRRLLLTGAIVFIAPGTSAQAAIACILAVVSSTVALYCQPHQDARDGQIYTLGAIVIFFSMFLSLAINTDVSTETNSSRDAFAVILILLNIGMVIAAVVQVALVGERAIKTGQQDSIFGLLDRGRSYSTSRKASATAPAELHSVDEDESVEDDSNGVTKSTSEQHASPQTAALQC
jgi:hypothetical protein